MILELKPDSDAVSLTLDKGDLVFLRRLYGPAWMKELLPYVNKRAALEMLFPFMMEKVAAALPPEAEKQFRELLEELERQLSSGGVVDYRTLFESQALRLRGSVSPPPAAEPDGTTQ